MQFHYNAHLLLFFIIIFLTQILLSFIKVCKECNGELHFKEFIYFYICTNGFRLRLAALLVLILQLKNENERRKKM
jgi:hypothetical protein